MAHITVTKKANKRVLNGIFDIAEQLNAFCLRGIFNSLNAQDSEYSRELVLPVGKHLTSERAEYCLNLINKKA